MSDPRHNLPLSADDFIGRERDISDLCRLLGNSRLVSLTGTGGIGKTRLAVHVADRLVSTFPDGAWFVDLSESTTAEQVVRSVARVLRVREGHGEETAEAVVTSLRPRRVLLLLDTCELATAAIGDLCRRFLESCPGVRILATSRQPLRVTGENIWRVPPLSLPARPAPVAVSGSALVRLPHREALRYEAVQLFVNRAHTVRPGFAMTRENSEQIIDVCRMLDGVPLAIELAAARIRILSVQQILHRLDDRFRLLATDGHDLPARQRSMRGALEWSHDLLTEAEQVLLRRLAVFCTWSLEMAEEVCSHDGIDREDVLDLHCSLVDKSLIVVDNEVDGTVNYRLPDTVRAYAAERLAEAGEEDELWERCLRESVCWAENMAAAVGGPLPWPDRLRYLRRLDHDRENATRLLDWVKRKGRAEEGIRLCLALRTYWFVRELFTDGSAHLRELLDTDPERQTRPVRARGLALYAELCLDVDGAQASDASAQEALVLARACGDPHATAVALSALCTMAVRTGENAKAYDYGHRALRAAKEVDDHFTEVTALDVLARVAKRRGENEAAEQLLNASIGIGESIGDQWSVARCLNRLGILSTERGDLDDATRRLDKALRLFAELGVAPETARCTAAVGYLELARRDIPGARRHFSSCLRISVASGRRGGIARALEALAALAVAEEQADRAASLAGVASYLRDRLDQPSDHAKRLLAEVKEMLPPEAADKAWEAWRNLPIEQVVERALAFPTGAATRWETPPSAPPPPIDAPPTPDTPQGAPELPSSLLSAAPSVLTPREREIAALVGGGLTNRQIAERLIISQATVARHIANIFRKLLFTSRTQLAEWARRHGLGS
ncbi:putative ATPase/DNA-binding NarL/FixJ family response regulator [Nocardiopsis mwathae]|uniref:Putative ATPase/DNA-binding NarL/FixJ family response regulator n=1 Tax=Nocardiopsis mwathae TaxID=1472723 RepID=A0A7W9YIY2_9ACTN|nr:LuxR C-terminal-related transcriptional regulator [Nocardiopsis mwathae]MBB6172942.1 putative ATPase/DNA-binding NarL/FixJ family response regulator [Nocardiopsis mwathae]